MHGEYYEFDEALQLENREDSTADRLDLFEFGADLGLPPCEVCLDRGPAGQAVLDPGRKCHGPVLLKASLPEGLHARHGVAGRPFIRLG